MFFLITGEVNPNSVFSFFFSVAYRFSLSVELLLPTEYRRNTKSCSPDLPAASGEIVRCVPSTQSPWPGRGDGSLCPEPERPWSHEQVSFLTAYVTLHFQLF